MSALNFKNWFPLVFIVITAALLASCTSTSLPGSGGVGEGRLVGQADLVEKLKAEGAEVETGDPVEQPFFSVKAQVLKVNGMDVQVFEYESEDLRAGESGAISPDGSVGTTMISWIDQPHFWASGKLIVLYVGSDPVTIDLLSGVLGEKVNQ